MLEMKTAMCLILYQKHWAKYFLTYVFIVGSLVHTIESIMIYGS